MVAQLETFYQTVAQLCFTLLGFWLIVLQTKFHEWSGKAERRRMLTNISLYFLLPGTMSLLAMLSIQATALWRIAFVVTSLVGAIETAFMLRSIRQRRTSSRIAVLLRLGGLLLFAIIACVALFPGAFNHFGLNALTVAGVLLTLIVVLGVTLVWLYFIEPVAPEMRATQSDEPV